MSEADLESRYVAQEVARIVQTPEFQRAPALRDLLLYLSRRFAARAEGPTTEYVIAQDLLKRGAEFDPKDDTSVHVRIRRLRVALDGYYAGRAQQQGRRIVIPPRSYDLAFVAMDPPRRFGAGQRTAAVAALGVVLALGLYWALGVRSQAVQSAADYPLVQVLAVENLTGASENDFFTDAVQRQLVADLQRFGQVRVFMEPGSVGARTDADFALRAVLVDISESMDLGVVLVRPDAPEDPLLSARVTSPILGGDYFEALGDISSQISAVVAGRSGAIARSEPRIQTVLADKRRRSGVSRNVFRCVALTNHFLDDYDTELFAQAHGCFTGLLPLAEADPFAASSYGTLLYHAVAEFNLLETAALPPGAVRPAAQVLAYAEEIVARFPSAADPYLLLGSVQNSIGLRRAAEVSLRQATQRNPGDATAFGVLAYLYLLEDRFSESIEMAQQAIRLSADPAGFVYFPIVFAALALGDRDMSRESGQAYVSKRSGEGAMAVQLLIARLEGDRATEELLAPEVSALPKPVTGISEFLGGDAIHATLRDWLPELLPRAQP